MRWWIEKILRTRIFKPNEVVLPGRWKPKSDTEKWILNHYPDPGYVNNNVKLHENSKKEKE